MQDFLHKDLIFEDNNCLKQLCGEKNSNIKEIEKLFGIKLHTRGNKITLDGETENTDSAEKFINQIYNLITKGYHLEPGDIELASRIILSDKHALEDIFLDTICVSTRKRIIAPKSLAQKHYIDAIRKNDIVFGIGPAGTGKTYLVMALAVSAFLNKQFNRIILTRPAVEAGEKLGFLPGDLTQKVDPYLRPLFDALYEMMDYDKASRLIEKGAIEVAPLAFMRGRTLNDAFVILDEAQNTTTMQMKMFLTRLGFNSKAVITGDITQIDLEKNEPSGLIHSENILKNIPNLDFVHFSNKDVVRHPIVKKIIEAYEKEV
ncbi:MAG: AAA family ATPase [Candidatus Dadabacteria bacterium]|nr:AAA family ATPase [Candidatus Dadabacteria bacterium]NIX14961.1 AAA family ATPase [Candidatus Dadabacteria bacterium]